MVLLSLFISIYRAHRQRKNERNEKIRGGEIPALVIPLIFLGSLFLCTGWSIKARFFPLLIVSTGIGLSVLLLISEIRYARFLKKQEGKPQGNEPKVTLKGEITMMLWLVGFLAVILVFGFWVSIALFTFLFMTLFGHERLKTVAIYTASIWLGMYLVFGMAIKASLFGGILGLSW
jgi:hypothetical protein